MKGICYKEPLFHFTIRNRKTQTRRIISFNKKTKAAVGDEEAVSRQKSNEATVKPRYTIGEVIYLKEPYYKAESGRIVYRFDCPDCISPPLNSTIKWKNKLFMPESVARYFIRITGVRIEPLQDIRDEDCIKEGIIEKRAEGRDLTDNNSISAYGIPEMATDTTVYATDWYDTPREAYAVLFDSINGKGTWHSNPFVWVYDYELIRS